MGWMVRRGGRDGAVKDYDDRGEAPQALQNIDQWPEPDLCIDTMVALGMAGERHFMET